MNRNIIFSAIIALSMAGNLNAQRQIDTQNNAWFMYFGNHRLTDKLGIHT